MSLRSNAKGVVSSSPGLQWRSRGYPGLRVVCSCSTLKGLWPGEATLREEEYTPSSAAPGWDGGDGE